MGTGRGLSCIVTVPGSGVLFLDGADEKRGRLGDVSSAVDEVLLDVYVGGLVGGVAADRCDRRGVGGDGCGVLEKEFWSF